MTPAQKDKALEKLKMALRDVLSDSSRDLSEGEVLDAALEVAEEWEARKFELDDEPEGLDGEDK